MLRFPLLAVSLGLYVGIHLTTRGTLLPWYEAQAFSIDMPSGDVWDISSGDVFLVFSIGMLLAENLRATRTGRESVVSHALSMMVFIIALLLFMTSSGYGNSPFFIFMAMCLLRVMAGFLITVVAARRNVAFTRAYSGGRLD
jgi:hypothetical protein